MRIGVLQAATREKHVARDERFDDGLVGVALLALVVDDARRAAFAVGTEARRILGEIAGVVHGEGDGRIDAACRKIAGRIHPGVKVLAAMAGSGVDEAGTGIVCDMIAGKQRHGEIIPAAEALEGVVSRQVLKNSCRHIKKAGCLQLCFREALSSKCICKD